MELTLAVIYTVQRIILVLACFVRNTAVNRLGILNVGTY